MSERHRSVLLRGGLVADASMSVPQRADVLIEAGRISSVAAGLAAPHGGRTVDCTDRIVMPGFVDAHSHADGTVFDADVQVALLRQGVTSIIAGQDGVSYAPGDGHYAAEYFAALLGPHPGYSGGVAGLLAGYDGRIPLNVAYLVPHGTVRHGVMGLSNTAATDEQLRVMREIVERGLAEGAVGLSTGLDYVPGLFADTAELTDLCGPVAAVDGVYVTHMRGGYESNARSGVDEVTAIARASGVRAHISHLHGPAALVRELVDDARATGVSLTFDAYPYRAGFTLLSMSVLPAELLALGTGPAVARLHDAVTRQWLAEDWLPHLAEQPHMGAGWTDRFTLAHVASPDYQWSIGATIEQASRRAGVDTNTLVLDVLAASELAVSVVEPLPPGRTFDELADVLRHEAHAIGTDGIYIGAHPHPRGWGSTARFLRRMVSERADLGWPAAAAHLSSNAVATFRLGERGFVRPGLVADLAVVDPDAVRDNATYDNPRMPADGIDDVLVAGVPVLASGELTDALPGGGFRRSAG